jgi:hypothetical protein
VDLVPRMKHVLVDRPCIVRIPFRSDYAGGSGNVHTVLAAAERDGTGVSASLLPPDTVRYKNGLGTF